MGICRNSRNLRGMSDFLDTLIADVERTIESGYYQVEAVKHRQFSLKENIIECNKNPIIAEIKFSSPSKNIIERDIDVVDVASAMKKGGAIGVSIVTEPKYFKGSLLNFRKVRDALSIPLLMKDFIISKVQVDAANKIGADAILLIQTLFDRGYSESQLNRMIEYAHMQKLEVLLEAHTEDEFLRANNSDADLVGINNRDLKTLNINLDTTKEILKKHNHHNRIIVTESGIESPSHLHILKDAGSNAFLIGATIMTAHNIEERVRELVER